MYETDLTIEECQKRLNNEFKTLKDNFQENCYIGKVSNDKFSFFYHEAYCHSNYGIFCSGKFIIFGSKTMIKLRYNSMFLSLSFFLIAFILLFVVSLYNFFKNNVPFPEFFSELVQDYSLILVIFIGLGILTILRPKNKRKIKMMNNFLIELLNLKKK